MLLEVKNLNTYYGDSHALQDMTLEVKDGEIVALLGRNGMGKTTLLKCLMGLLPVKTGRIEFDGKDLTHQTAELRARLGVGFVPQGRQIFSQLTVEENLAIGLNARRNKLRKIPERIFELFPVLKDMLHRRGGDLSGGQQQQLAIGRALVLEPKLLILDEPCEGIQPNIVQQIGDVLLKLNEEENVTILLVEQKLPFARRVGQKFTIMDKGRSVASGAMQELSEALIQKHLTV